MHPFLRKILDATQLTRSGKLAEATTTIQRALAHPAPASTHPVRLEADLTVEATVIDAAVEDTVPAILVHDTPALPPHTPTLVVDDAAEVDEAPPAVRRPTGPGRFLASSYTCADGTRAFKLFVPDGFEGEALPLVVMLHGCTQDPDDFAAGTQMNALAQEQGFMVLYPEQAPRSNAHKCWNWFSPRDQGRGAGEPALLAGMTRHVLQTHGIDHDRVYVAGLSAGGAMAAILAREYPDLFAAAGVHSGVAPGSAQDVASAFAIMKSGPGTTHELLTALMTLRPAAGNGVAAAAATPASGAPLIVFHGDADKTVVAANGDAVVAAALGDAGTAVSISFEGDTTSDTRSFQRTVWRRDAAAADAPTLAEHWVVHGSPHAWSGGSESGSYTDPAGPDASREM
ncbi:MAG TPA: PHB depolymerase family esterase, partial [Caldimonas sp.]